MIKVFKPRTCPICASLRVGRVLSNGSTFTTCPTCDRPASKPDRCAGGSKKRPQRGASVERSE
jgi:hypothetical protein